MPIADADVALAAAIRAVRDERGATQEQIASDAGITVGTYARVERGQANPTWTTLRRIAAALGVSVSELAIRAGE